MLPLRPHFVRRRVVLTAILVLPVAAGGCDNSGVGVTYPVVGRVTLDGKPLAAKLGTVLFEPDASRGNRSPYKPVGEIDPDGNYRLMTQGKPGTAPKAGAPPGWYKVIVTALKDDPKHPSGMHRSQRPVAQSLVPARYGQAATTDLTVEVVEGPAEGAYDLKLKSE
jgi:hypothetical protein